MEYHCMVSYMSHHCHLCSNYNCSMKFVPSKDDVPHSITIKKGSQTNSLPLLHYCPVNECISI